MSESRDILTTKAEYAQSFCYKGYNCAQSVLSAFCEKYGMDQETALQMGDKFQNSGICGAIAGAVCVIGLRFGQADAESKDSEWVCYTETVRFYEKFRAHYGSILCQKLLGRGMDSANAGEPMRNALGLELGCVELIRTAAEILEEMGY